MIQSFFEIPWLLMQNLYHGVPYKMGLVKIYVWKLTVVWDESVFFLKELTLARKKII